MFRAQSGLASPLCQYSADRGTGVPGPKGARAGFPVVSGPAAGSCQPCRGPRGSLPPAPAQAAGSSLPSWTDVWVLSQPRGQSIGESDSQNTKKQWDRGPPPQPCQPPSCGNRAEFGSRRPVWLPGNTTRKVQSSKSSQTHGAEPWAGAGGPVPRPQHGQANMYYNLTCWHQSRRRNAGFALSNQRLSCPARPPRKHEFGGTGKGEK